MFLQEELDHALQGAGTGPLKDHLRRQAHAFVASLPGAQAKESLERDHGYQFDSDGEAAMEIGVRLMANGRYRELGLSHEQAHAGPAIRASIE